MGRSLSYWYVKDDYFKQKRIENDYFSYKYKEVLGEIQIGNFLNYDDCNYCDVLGNYSYLGWIERAHLKISNLHL